MPTSSCTLDEGPPVRGFTATFATVDTMAAFAADSDPDTFVDQAVKALKERDLKRRRFQSCRQLRLGHGCPLRCLTVVAGGYTSEWR